MYFSMADTSKEGQYGDNGRIAVFMESSTFRLCCYLVVQVLSYRMIAGELFGRCENQVRHSVVAVFDSSFPLSFSKRIATPLF